MGRGSRGLRRAAPGASVRPEELDALCLDNIARFKRPKRLPLRRGAAEEQLRQGAQDGAACAAGTKDVKASVIPAQAGIPECLNRMVWNDVRTWADVLVKPVERRSNERRQPPLRSRAPGRARRAAWFPHHRAADFSDPEGTLALSHQCPGHLLRASTGSCRLFLREPKEEVRLGPGDTYSVKPRRPHLVTNGGDRSATFLVLQGIGEYDFVPLV